MSETVGHRNDVRTIRSRAARELLNRAILVASSLLVSFVLCEAALRSMLGSQYHVWPPGLTYQFQPLSEVMRGVTGPSQFVINRYGLRGDPPPAGTVYRILTVGGSTTECLYLDEVKAWPYLVQEALANDRPVWVGNVGKSGMNSRHNILQVEYLTRQHPNINAIILLVGINDFAQRLAKGEHYPSFPGIEMLSLREYETLMSEAFFSWPGADHRAPLYKNLAMWRTIRDMKYRYFAAPPKQLLLNEDGSILSLWRAHRRSASAIRPALPNLTLALDEYVRNLGAIARIANERGVRLILATQPYLWRSDLSPAERDSLWLGGVGNYQEEPGHEYYSVTALAEGMNLYNQRLLRVCQDRSLECVDLEQALPKEARIFYDDVHFTEAGARLVADVFAQYLTSTSPFLKQI